MTDSQMRQDPRFPGVADPRKRLCRRSRQHRRGHENLAFFAYPRQCRDRRQLRDRAERDDRPEGGGRRRRAHPEQRQPLRGVTLEDDVFCGPSCVFTNVNNPRSFVSRKNEFRRTQRGKGASIGANATIVCGHDIGAYAFIAAGAVVTSDVPAYALMIGVPARRAGWMSRAGEKLGA